MQKTETLRLFDSVSKGLPPGVWTVKVRQTVEKDKKSIVTTDESGNGNDIVSQQRILVENPVFGFKRDCVMQRTPLPGTQGAYTDVVPHVVLNGCVAAGDMGLCLLVLKEGELEASGEILAGNYRERGKQPDILTDDIVCLSEEKKKQSFSYIRLSRPVFEALAPKKEELPFLSHYRQVYIGDKPELDLDAEGIFTVVLGNRIPAYSGGERSDYQIHVVALAGIYRQIEKEKKDWKSVELLSLDSWSFTVSGKKPDSFQDLCKRLSDEKTEWMFRLSAPEKEDGMETAARRLQEGYLPLLYHTRLGDEGICWGRSACVPVPVEQLPPGFVPESGDAALCYDERDGVFDISYSLAFETGRIIAAEDESFLDALFSLRQKAQELMDGRFSRKLWNMGKEPAAQKLASILKDKELEKLGEAFFLAKLEEKSGTEKRMVPEADREDVEAYIKEKKELLYSELKEETGIAAKWLARLLLLYPVPAETLILHKSLLPKESVRFFFLDENWLRCLYDGAVSIGLYSSRQSLFNRLMREYLQEQTFGELLAYRASLYGQASPKKKTEPYTGFFIHGDIVGFWPTVSVQAWDEKGQPLAILRMEHIACGILIAIFDGKAAEMIVNEPTESLTLRFDAKKYGDFLGKENVLEICPQGKAGLASALAKEAGISAETVSGAAFARRFLSMGERTIFGKVERP